MFSLIFTGCTESTDTKNESSDISSIISDKDDKTESEEENISSGDAFEQPTENDDGSIELPFDKW